jgi:hypothetical protein
VYFFKDKYLFIGIELEKRELENTLFFAMNKSKIIIEFSVHLSDARLAAIPSEAAI